ncbi:MAG: hypothetical protein WKF82_13860 [Nocardioidaceae bacterium]
MHRQLAGALTGRLSKWAMLFLWIAVVATCFRTREQSHRCRGERRHLLAAR